MTPGRAAAARIWQGSPLGTTLWFARHILPRAQRELAVWRNLARTTCPEPYRTQALASIAGKAFHSIGGSVYAAARPESAGRLCRAIVAYQTMSDYLDNLCDRLGVGVTDGEAFGLAHEAMLDALRPEAALGGGDGRGSRPYLAGFAALGLPGDDGGYLYALGRTCARELTALPGYAAVRPAALELARLYAGMQARKHIAPQRRVGALKRWFAAAYPGDLARLCIPGGGSVQGDAADHSDGRPLLTWFEFAAAAGSTLGVFALWALAASPRATPAAAAACLRAYFPTICASHILFDYLIDQAEDRDEGDLNFVSFYPDAATMARRLEGLYADALQRAAELVPSGLHTAAVAGLAALYLSDPKAGRLAHPSPVRALLRRSGFTGQTAHLLCRLLRSCRAL